MRRALVLGLGLVGCGGVPWSAPIDGPVPPGERMRLIDAHLHTDFTGEPEPTSGIPMTRDELLREMHEAGVVGAVAHVGRDGEGDVPLDAENVIHCAGIGETVDVARVEAGLRDKRWRCIKIYLGYVHRWASDAAYQPLYRLAAREGVPVVFHTGDTYSTHGKLKYADPLTIDEVAVDHPDVTFVIAHAGNPWIQSAAEVAYKNPNVYLDGSALLIGNLRDAAPEAVDDYIVTPIHWVLGYLEDPRKLMFGTDWPLVDIGDYAAAFARAVPAEQQPAVFHDNAVRVFGLRP